MLVNVKTTRAIVSRYEKDGKRATLNSRTITEGRNKEEVWFWFDNWNPLPVKGKFKSTYHVIHKWLLDNGWKPIVKETHIVHDGTTTIESQVNL